MNILNINIVRILYTLPGLIIGFSFHEFAHAWVADKKGDPTPRMQGRLTLNPKAHVDPLGMILLILAGFGWAKPVQTNPSYYRDPRRDDLQVSIAGSLANLTIAFVLTGLLKIFFLIINFLPAGLGYINVHLYNMFIYAIIININLALFNLLPIPPLDGFHVIRNLVPSRHYRVVDFLERYGQIILLLMIVSDFTAKIISPITGGIISLFYLIFGL